MNKIQSTTQKWIDKGKSVWIVARGDMMNPSEDTFLEGKVVEIHKKDAIISINQLEHRVQLEDCLKLTYGAIDVADMVDLEQLNEPELLFNIKRRYLNDAIFTYCGPTLVIVNPYIFIQKLFNDAVLFGYQAFVFSDTLEYKNLVPHIFGLAAFCLWQLFQNQRNQSIVISGESGAGKTQNTKYCLKFLASLGRNVKYMLANSHTFTKRFITSLTLKSIMKKTSSAKLVGIEDKILGCNEILEAFGNAKTIRNDNSSRFGKLILLLYGETQIDIRSASITSYLLQKSRIVSLSQGQRNYHVFYYFLKGASVEQKRKYLLSEPLEGYYYLNQSSVHEVKGVSDDKRFHDLQNEFDVYITREESGWVFRVLSIVLNAGNLRFRKEETKNNEEIAVITNKQFLKNIAQLLGANYDELQEIFQLKTRKMGGNVIKSPLRYDEALALRDSFAKNIYERTFNFLVSKLNQKIELQKVAFEQGASKAYRKSIGLLDIFGFQVLTINSLQQFFINFANEKLQQLYVSYIFKEEQNEFLRQGLKEFCHDIGFQDNKPIIDLFELYPLGIFHLINESSELNKLDESLPETIVSSHPKNIFLNVPKSKKSCFSIIHSCSPVSYTTSGFTSKNKDEFPQQILQIIAKGGNPILQSIIIGQAKKPEQNQKGRSAAVKFLGSKFLNEMTRLTEQLYSCDCHFVRCIKPNSTKSAKMFDSQAVLQSLRYLGVLDSIIIRKLGYIYRRPFRQFFKKFFELQQYIFNYKTFIANKSQQQFKELCREIINKYARTELENKQILFGNKKILVKESALNHLQSLTNKKRKLRITSANKINHMFQHSQFRGAVKVFLKRVSILKTYTLAFIQKTREHILVKKAVRIQNMIKKYLWQKRLEKIKEKAEKSVTMISNWIKMMKQRRTYLEIRANIIRLQANCRFQISTAAFLRQKQCEQIQLSIFERCWTSIKNRKAILIQKIWKGYKHRKAFKQKFEQIRHKLKITKIREQITSAIITHRFNAFAERVSFFLKPIVKLQVIFRSLIVHKAYLRKKKSVVIIQKAYRRHLRKQHYLWRLWENYKINLYHNQQLKLNEIKDLVPNELSAELDSWANCKSVRQTTGLRVQMSPNNLFRRYAAPPAQAQQINFSINDSIEVGDKNTFQVYIADYDILNAPMYTEGWLKKWCIAKQEMRRRNEYPIHIDISQGQTSILTNKDKLYSLQPSDGKFIKCEINCLPKSIEHDYICSADRKLYVWNHVHGEPPSEVKFDDRLKLSKVGVSSVVVTENISYLLDLEGRVYCGLDKEQNDSFEFGKLVSYELLNKQLIKQIAASNDFVHFLTTTGQLLSSGTNAKGQLGLGFRSNQKVNRPEINSFFQRSKQILESISVGMAHSVAKSKLGYLYTWGDNCYNQVSSKVNACYEQPQQLESEEGIKIKVLQAAAGARATFYLSEQLRTVGFGTSSTFPKSFSATPFILELFKETCLNKHLIQVKINVQWNEQVSVLTVNAIDLTKCKAGAKQDIIFKYCRMLAKQWDKNNVYPPYSEWADNVLQLSDLRKLKFNGVKQGTPKTKAKDSILQELKTLMDLRKTSTIFRDGARKKMEEAMMHLKSKGVEEWSSEDKELHAYVKSNQQIFM